MTRHHLSAFTLIELIVVMAIIVTLSVIGFISYNSYIRDARNATRQSQLDEATAAIDRFIFNNARAPKCRNGATVINGAAVCYFTPVDGAAGVGDATKAKGPTTLGASVAGYLPCNASGSPLSCGTFGSVTAANMFGIDSADWNQFNLKSNPTDPRGSYFMYATDGATGYALLATREEAAGYSAMIRGFKAMPWDINSVATDQVKAALWPAAAATTTIYGFTTTGGTFQNTTITPILGDSNFVTNPTPNPASGPVPYTW